MSTVTPPFDTRQLRDVLGTFITGVTVVTTRDAAGVAHGVTANSFSSVSLEPPLVLWSQALTSRSHPAFRDGAHFAVNILAHDQVALSQHFARSRDDKFAAIAHGSGAGGAPLLDGASAQLECVKVAAHVSGDHVIFIGRIVAFRHAGHPPLAYGGGAYLRALPHDPHLSHD